MPTLRELTEAIQRHRGVQVVVILGADGLVIETHDPNHDAAEALAARAPAVVLAARQLGQAASAGDAQLMLMEFENGYGIVLRLSAPAMLYVAASRDADLSQLLYDLR